MRWLVTAGVCAALLAASHSAAADPDPYRCTALQTTGWILGGVGAAGVVVGAITAGLAIEQQDINEEHCDDRTQVCDQQGIDAHDRGTALGAVTTATWIVSGGLLAAGLVLVVGTGDDEPSVALSSDGRGANLEIVARW